MCCVRSNLHGAFTVLDGGLNVNARRKTPDIVSSQCELASIIYVRDSTLYTACY